MPAFPTAEGFGRNATGGRQGDVYFVTKTTDDGSQGTWRHAVTQSRSSPRTVIFQTGGSIALTSNLNIFRGDLTVAGQTAPGGGIQFRNYEMNFRGGCNNVIMRFVRFRLGNAQPGNLDALGLWSDNGSGTSAPMSNFIFDHCTFMWGTDGCLDFQGDIQDVTIQWCLFGENLSWLGSPGPNLISSLPWMGRQLRFSIHHNLYAHGSSRVPSAGAYILASQIGLGIPNCLVDFRNNLIYNWQGSGGGTGFNAHYQNLQQRLDYMNVTTQPACVANVVGNHWIKGNGAQDNGVISVNRMAKMYLADNLTPLSPSTPTNSWGAHRVTLASGLGVSFGTPGLPVREDHRWGDGTNNGWVAGQVDSNWDPNNPPRDNSEPNPYPSVVASGPFSIAQPITAHAVGLIKELVLKNCGAHIVYRSPGVATIIRDSVEERLAGTVAGSGGQVRNLSGTILTSPTTLDYPTLAAGTPPADSNSDGIPDTWAAANLPGGATAQTLAPNGYTYLENYLNELAGDIAAPPTDMLPPSIPTGVTIR